MKTHEIILAQLGGNRFIAMTGAKNFTHAEDGSRLSFKLPRKYNSINYVSVKLELNDTYTMTFCNITGLNVREVAEVEMVYADQLQTIFTEKTGLNTSL